MCDKDNSINVDAIFLISSCLLVRKFRSDINLNIQIILFTMDLIQDLKDFFRRVAEVTFADAHRFRTGEG